MLKKIYENKYFIFDKEKNILKYLIKNIIYMLFTPFIYIFSKVFHPKFKEKKYYSSICAIFKNEGKYLKEWIEYNLLIGIEHFYMYNNNSSDNYLEVLNPYIDSGVVDLIQWPKNQAQMEAYYDCIQNRKEESNWIGFVDIDEFIVPIKQNSINLFLKKFEKNCGSVMIYWKLFGSSGLVKRDEEELVTSDFSVCWPKLSNIGKCFYNTSYNFEFNNKNKLLHHCLWTKYLIFSFPPVNSNGKIVYKDIHKLSNNSIQINHYFTKSYDEYREKKAKGDVYFKINPHDEEYFYEHEMKCTSFDYSIFKYIVKLKKRIGESNNYE